MVEYFYSWADNQFASNVDIIVSVIFGPVHDWQQGLNIRMDNCHLLCSPSRFCDEEIDTVRFDHVTFVFHVGPDDDDDES